VLMVEAFQPVPVSGLLMSMAAQAKEKKPKMEKVATSATNTAQSLDIRVLLSMPTPHVSFDTG